MTKRNKKLFHDIADFIEKYPEHYDQTTWCVSHGLGIPKCRPSKKPACGTTGCIAGLAVMLTPKKDRPETFSIFLAAQELLGLTYDQADSLFYGPAKTPDQLRKIAEGGRIR